MFYKAFLDIDLGTLRYPEISTFEYNTLGSGVYFAHEFDFALIFANNYARKNYAVIGHYDFEVPESKLEFKLDELSEYKSKYNFNEFRSIVVTDREICVKEKINFNLKSFSIVLSHGGADELFNLVGFGHVVGWNIVKDIPVSELNRVNDILYGYVFSQNPESLAGELLTKHWENHNDVFQRDYDLITKHFKEYVESVVAYRAIVLDKNETVNIKSLYVKQSSWSSSYSGILNFLDNKKVNGSVNKFTESHFFKASIIGINLKKLAIYLNNKGCLSDDTLDLYLKEDEFIALEIENVVKISEDDLKK